MTVKAALRALPALVALGGPVNAHPEFSTVGTNRYVTAAVWSGHIDVSDALLEGTLTGAEERRRLDGDGDGRISDVEVAEGERRQRAAWPSLTIELDGKALSAPATVSIDLGGDARVGTAPVMIERRMRFEMSGVPAPGARRLRLALVSDPPRLLETEIGVVLGPGLALRDGTDRLRLSGPRASVLQDRSATFVIVATTPASASRGPTLAKVAALAGVGALVFLAATFSMRRRSRPSARG
jgi:hypothetical protein